MSHNIGDEITMDENIKLKIIDIDTDSNSCPEGKYTVMGTYPNDKNSNIKIPFLARIPSLDIGTADTAAKIIDNAITLDKTMLKQIKTNQSKDIKNMIKGFNIKIGCHDLSNSGGKKSRKRKVLKSKRRTRRRRKLVKKTKKRKKRKKNKKRRTMKKRRRRKN
jgi:hypothetical protein